MQTENSQFSMLDDLRLDANVRELFERIPDLQFFIKDLDGRLVFCNAAHRHNIFRYQGADRIYGKENYDFFPNALASAFAADDRNVIQSGKPMMERVELNITHSGELCWFSTTKIPAVNTRGEIVGLVGITRRLETADARLSEFELLFPAIHYVHEHFAERIPITHLAHVCRMTETTFRREFRNVFRMTPMKFIIRLRLHEACSRLVEGTEPIGKISYRCGFEDQNYFSRQFKLVMGMTPTEFRRHHRGGPGE